jgi:SAM-dependent methyltransferase
MRDALLRVLRRPGIRDRLVPVLRRFGLLGLAFRRYERMLARTSPDGSSTVAEVDDSGLPLPPPELRVLVAGTPDVAWFLGFGRAMFETVVALSERHGAPVAGLHRVLEFGCGSGRVLRHWQGVRGPDIHGTDYNPRLVEWCRQHLPFTTIAQNQLDPPLPYANESFDLIYAISVFTHLKASAQEAWISELRRVLTPGGRLLFTTHGSSVRDQMTEAERRAFDAGQLVVRYGETSGMNLCTAYHPESLVRAQLAAGFTVDEVIPAGQREFITQDVYFLTKRPGA